MAYVVGLIATDGCLINSGRHLGFVTEDEQLMATFLECLGRAPRYRTEVTRTGNLVYRSQFGDVAFYRWLQSIGLMQRKSLVLGALDAPDAVFPHLVRGLLDGDGSIINGLYRADTHGRPGYRWEYLQTKFVSGSRDHVEWLSRRMRAVIGVDGYIQSRRGGFIGSLMTELRYGKRASHILLPALYANSAALRLERKWLIWADYARRHGLKTE